MVHVLHIMVYTIAIYDVPVHRLLAMSDQVCVYREGGIPTSAQRECRCVDAWEIHHFLTDDQDERDVR